MAKTDRELRVEEARRQLVVGLERGARRLDGEARVYDEHDCQGCDWTAACKALAALRQLGTEEASDA